MRLDEGALFARYKVEASLGGGGMGHVYRAFDTQLQRRIALKILHADTGRSGKDGAAAALILREARAAAALNHMNAVTVFEVGEHEGVPFMAMELVLGSPLRQLIGRNDIPIARKLRWLSGIASALAAAHAAGIVHLDIKPENVIVRDDDVAKVLDFGIARRRSFDPDTLIRTETDVGRLHSLTNGGGSIVGTPRYMAPEQIGRGELDGRTDQFAWGVVAYEVLTGRNPWPAGDDIYDLFSSIVRMAPPPLRAKARDVPDAVADVIARAMSKSPDSRFPSMTQVAEAIALACGEMQTVPVNPPSWVGRTSAPPSSSELVTLQADPNAATVDVASMDLSPRMSDIPSVPLPSLPMGAPGDVTQRSVGTQQPTIKHPASRRAAGVASVLVTVLVIVVGLWLMSSRVSSQNTDASASPCAEPAKMAYSAGARAQRNGNWDQARRSFQEAASQDPECAAAHARLVVIGYWTDPPSKTRDALRRALDLKDRLSNRDRDLLHCYEAVLWATPPDERAFAACLDQLSEAHPKDAELAYLAADFAPAPARMRELAQRALDIDPQYSDAWQSLAVALTQEDNEKGALEAIDQCITHVTTSLDCFAQRATLLRRMGRCDDLEATGRKWLARSPESTSAHYTLASALAAEGKPRPAVEEALATRWAHMKGSADTGNEHVERAALAALFGDLSAAEGHARELDALVKGTPDAELRIDAALWLLDLGIETGSIEATGKLAQDFWARKAAWDTSARRVGYNAKSPLFEPQLLHALHVTGKMAGAELAAARAAWIEGATKARSLTEETIWVLGHALQSETPEEAAEAVRVMPPSISAGMRWTPKVPGLLTYAYAGRALFLAGRTDDALKILQVAFASCSALEDPLLHTRVSLWIGEALAKKGDRDLACKAFAVVTRRWGSVPASRTAKQAATGASALGCAQ